MKTGQPLRKPVKRYHRDDTYTFWQRVWQRIIGGDPNGRPHMAGQSCWVWCPRCGFDLCSHPDTKVGRLREDDSRDMVYSCGVCHLESVWDFGSFMAPTWLYNRCPAARHHIALTKIVKDWPRVDVQMIAKLALEPGFQARDFEPPHDTHHIHVTEPGADADVSS